MRTNRLLPDCWQRPGREARLFFLSGCSIWRTTTPVFPEPITPCSFLRKRL